MSKQPPRASPLGIAITSLAIAYGYQRLQHVVGAMLEGPWSAKPERPLGTLLMWTNYPIALAVFLLACYGLYRLGIGRSPFTSKHTRANMRWLGHCAALLGPLAGGWLVLQTVVFNATGGHDWSTASVGFALILASLIGGIGLAGIARNADRDLASAT